MTVGFLGRGWSGGDVSRLSDGKVTPLSLSPCTVHRSQRGEAHDIDIYKSCACGNRACLPDAP